MVNNRYFVDVNGHKWSFLKFGKGKPLVLLHGFLNFSEYFEPIANDLSNEFEVIVPDLPGSGYTKRLEKNTYQNIARELREFIKKIGYSKVNFFGTSLGGTILLELGINYPEITDTLFIHSPWWRFSSLGIGPIEKVELKLVNIPTSLLKIFQNDLILKIFLKSLQNNSTDLDFALKTYKERVIKSLKLIDIDANKELFNSIKKLKLQSKLKNFNCNATLITGENDYVISSEETIKLAKLIKNDKVLLIKKSSHGIIIDDPKKIVQIIKSYKSNKEFLTSNPDFEWLKV